VIIILAGYVLNSLGPTIFQAKKAVDQFGKDVENQNKLNDEENFLKKIRSEQNLSGWDLSGLNLKGYDLSGKNLSNVKFIDSDLTDVDFTNSNLNGANFARAKIYNTDFSNMDLRNIIGFEPRISPVFWYSNFHGANLSGFTGILRAVHSDFTNADLSGIKISRSSFSNNDFTNADLSNGLWLGGNLEGTIHKNYYSNCSGVGNESPMKFQSNDLTNADLSGSRFECYTMGSNTFSNTNFKNTVLQMVTLHFDYLQIEEMKGVTISGHSVVQKNSQHLKHLEFFDSVGCNINPTKISPGSNTWISGTC
jgi:uncharacterized protein YjbI with pentapeptide repeats